MTRNRRVQGRRHLRVLLLLLLCCAVHVRVAAAAPIKVACIGEHTTHSDLYPTANREQQPAGMQEYPRMLQDLMGSSYDVRNFGDCCASVIQGYAASETHPYLRGSNYKNSVSFAPDVVVIGSWGRHDWGLSALTALPVFTIQKFQADYETLVKAYLALSPVPKIYCSLPIPILAGKDGPDNGYKTSPAADAIKAVAAKYNLPTIDLYSAFLGHPELYRAQPMKDAEGEHVNDAGMHKMAELVHDALLGNANPSGGAGGQSSSGAGGSPAAGADGVGGGSPAGGGDAGTSGGASAAAGTTSATGGADGVSGGTTGTAGVATSTAGTAGGLTATSTAAGANDTPASPDSSANGCNLASHGDARAAWLSALLVAAGSVLLARRRAR